MRVRLRQTQRINWQLVDVVVASLLALDLALEAALANGVPRADRLVTALSGVVFAAPIAVRRRWPAGALVAGCAIACFQQLLHGQLYTTLPSQSAMFTPILCSYGAGAWLQLRRGLIALAFSCVLLYGVVVAGYLQRAPGAGTLAGGTGILIFFLVAPWAVGRVARESSRRAKAFADLEDRITAEQAERERAAIAEERVMIGRELQDIIAHTVSMMVVQAGGARRLLTVEPERARASILTVEETGREALAEMRRLLGVLRRDDDPRALAPQPGLDELPELAQKVHQLGLECTIARGNEEALTPGVDLVAYRMLEATLGAVAECGGNRAEVAVASHMGILELDVQASGVNADVDHRLDAISERIALYDGRLRVEPGPSGALLVSCRLPLSGAVVL